MNQCTGLVDVSSDPLYRNPSSGERIDFKLPKEMIPSTSLTYHSPFIVKDSVKLSMSSLGNTRQNKRNQSE